MRTRRVVNRPQQRRLLAADEVAIVLPQRRQFIGIVQPLVCVLLIHLRLVVRENCGHVRGRCVGITRSDRGRLDSLTRSSSVRAGLATRARIVLLAAEGVPNIEIAVRTGTTRPTVLKWRGRYGESGIDGCSMSLGPGVHR